MSNIKLPKQWKHWAMKAGLKPERARGAGHLFYLRGRDRNWRVNMYGHFECSCPLEHFDRWANSRGAAIPIIPQTERQFLIAVSVLLLESKDAK